MVANGQLKSLNDLAPPSGGSTMKYTVNDQNYGKNTLGCDDAVSIWRRSTITISLYYETTWNASHKSSFLNHLMRDM